MERDYPDANNINTRLDGLEDLRDLTMLLNKALREAES